MTYTVRAYDYDSLKGQMFSARDYEHALEIADDLVDYGEYMERNPDLSLRILGRGSPYDVAHVYYGETNIVYTAMPEYLPGLLEDPEIITL